MSWIKFTPSHVVLHPVGHPNMEADLADTRSQLVPAPGQSQNSFSSENWISSSGHHLASENKMNSSWLELADPDFCDHHDGGTLLHLRRGRRTLVLEICLNHNFSSTHSSGLPRV